MKNWLRLETSQVRRRGLPSLAFLLLLIPLTAMAQRQERIVDTWKPLHYDVNITLNNELTEISNAKTEITAIVLKDGVKIIDLDFGAMPINSVKLDGEPAHYDRSAELLNVALPHPFRNGETVNIVVNYHGRPKDGLVFATDRDGKPSVTGDNWPNRVHQWIPCLDYPSAKATVSFTVTDPQRDAVVANGKFINITGNAVTSHWRYEEAKAIPPYCMVIIINEGVKVDATKQTVTPLSYHVSQRDRSYATKGFSPAAPAVAFFSETVAPYPYEKLGLIIGATKYGGMENSSPIVFTSTLFDQHSGEQISARFGIPTRIESVVAHEIAHQWFGDSVTESTWADLWLSEGFATYFAGLFIEKYDGEEAFRDYLRNAAERCFNYEKQRNTPIHDTETQDLMRLLNENNYQKGAWVLHMLRKRLGDEAFFRGLRNYYQAHAEANATTEDLRDALEKASGQNLHDFFTRWIYGSGHPIYEVSSASMELGRAGGFLTITLKQTQSGDAFLDPVPIEITSGSEKKRIVIRPEGKIATARVRIGGGHPSIEIDPDGTLLKE